MISDLLDLPLTLFLDEGFEPKCREGYLEAWLFVLVSVFRHLSLACFEKRIW